MSRRPFDGSGPAMASPSPVRLFAGFGLWALAFLVLYVGHALACLYVEPGTGAADFARTVLVSFWLALVVLLAYLAWGSLTALGSSPTDAGGVGANARFLRRVTLMLDVFACAATFATGMPLAWVKMCGA